MEPITEPLIPIGRDLYAVRVGDAGVAAVLVDHVRREILLSADVPPARRPFVIAAAVADAWRDAVEQHGRQLLQSWERFDQITAAVDGDLAGELDEDHAGDVFVAFGELRRLGVRFDVGFTAKMNTLAGLARHVRHQQRGGVWVESSPAFIDDDEP